MILYRDHTVEREALKVGDINYYEEMVIQSEPNLDSNLDKSYYAKRLIPIANENLRMLVLHMNMTRHHLNDVRVRKAMVLALNMDWPNQQFYGGRLSVLTTPGQDSPLAPRGAPSPEVLDLLKGDHQFDELSKPFEDIGFTPLAKITDRRERLKAAMALLREAGYAPANGRLEKNGKPVELKVLIWGSSRLLSTMSYFEGQLKALGIQLNYKMFNDTSQMLNIIKSQDYDFYVEDIAIHRGFDVLDPENMTEAFGSSYSGSNNPNSIDSNISNLISPTLDRIFETMLATEVASPHYRPLVDATLRILSAEVPFILLGEQTTAAIYSDKRICLPPVSTRLLEAAYFSSQACP
jgi:microcin C transport system substrate-binding protein